MILRPFTIVKKTLRICLFVNYIIIKLFREIVRHKKISLTVVVSITDITNKSSTKHVIFF